MFSRRGSRLSPSLTLCSRRSWGFWICVGCLLLSMAGTVSRGEEESAATPPNSGTPVAKEEAPPPPAEAEGEAEAESLPEKATDSEPVEAAAAAAEAASTSDNNSSDVTLPSKAETSWMGLFDFLYRTWQHEFKFVLPNGQTQCFYQDVQNKTAAYVSYEVLSGNDKKIDFQVSLSNGTRIYNVSRKSEAFKDITFNASDIIEICFRNRGKMIGSFKKVQVYISGMNLDPIGNFSDSTDDVTQTSMESLVHIVKKVMKMMKIQSVTRMRKSKDFELAKENFSYVQTWAILHLVLFVTTSVLQVAFVRRLFNMPFSVRPIQARA